MNATTRKLDQGTTEAPEQRSGHPGTEDDVWIDVVSPNYARGETGQFFGRATLSMPFGPNGPSEARVSFNLSGYIRHEIAKAMGAQK